jgi:uncharacterized membrane protein
VGPWSRLFCLPIVLLFCTGMLFPVLLGVPLLGLVAVGTGTAQEVLDRRFARGEISCEEYEHAREIL